MNQEALSKSPTRAQLLAAGRAIVLRKGFSGLTVREVAAAARANLGSFVYHFGTRDAYIEALIEDWYAPLLQRVTVAAGGESAAISRLRTAILQLVDYGINQNAFVGRVLMAGAEGEPAARKFMKSLAGRHPDLLLQLIGAAQAEHKLVREDPLQLLVFLMTAVGLPMILAGAWHGPPLFGKAMTAQLGRIARDRNLIVQRLDWAILGLTPQEH